MYTPTHPYPIKPHPLSTKCSIRYVISVECTFHDRYKTGVVIATWSLARTWKRLQWKIVLLILIQLDTILKISSIEGPSSSRYSEQTEQQSIACLAE